jgi:GNAT superfamily N-acetyltransferase
MNSAGTDYTVVEIESRDHPLWPVWKEIYLDSFPPNERMTLAFFEGFFERKLRGEASSQHMLALTNGAGELLCIGFYETNSELRVAFLWYLATCASERGQGIGGRLYAAMRERARAAGARLLVFEVEIPELEGAQPDGSAGFAQRRIDWYRRQGARLLEGIEYFQEVDSTDELTPMHLMVDLWEPMSAEETFAILKDLFGEALEQKGSLRLS